jgi:hypothetical protein
MHEIFEAGRVALRSKQETGIEFAQARLNWRSSTDKVEANLREVKDTIPCRIASQREAAEKQHRLQAAARQMLIKAAITGQ